MKFNGTKRLSWLIGKTNPPLNPLVGSFYPSIINQLIKQKIENTIQIFRGKIIEPRNVTIQWKRINQS